MNAIRTTVLLADIAPRHEGGGGGHTALVVVSVVLAVAVAVLVYAAFQRRR
ncbi:hypothetical protein [Streptomyces sp. IBSBF 2435]|uniref:hypothetical protein n=1 Tax=Streptomyces sp. IBSBF 2435 TaxID=2903531 RepID=UPI002FDC6A0B